MVITTRIAFSCLLASSFFFPAVQGQYFFCSPLANETWAGFVQAIEDSYRLAVICPFRISGDGCPSLQEYPEGLVVGRQQQGAGSEVTIIECDPDFSDRYGEADANTQCIIDCPGRHFTVGQSSTGLILTNMILSGATNSSVYVQEGGRLEVVNGIFERNMARDTNGGAIEAEPGSDVSVEFSTFRDNKGSLGGAVHVPSSTLKVKQSNFVGNIASEAGGAIFLGADSIADIEGSSFSQNEASTGGAIYLAQLGLVSISQSIFNSNIALGVGGAINAEGIATIDGSTFQDNVGIEGGGAINLEVLAAATLLRNAFINNISTGYGPAVYDRYNIGVIRESNSACGNTVITQGRQPINSNLQCEGVYTVAGRRRWRRCQVFEAECIAPTNAPSRVPTTMPSPHPTAMPSMGPTVSHGPSSSPTATSSNSPSREPSSLPTTESPSEPPTRTLSDVTSAIPSDLPSLIPSDLPSLIPSDAPSLLPSDSPSLLPSDKPSLSPTDADA